MGYKFFGSVITVIDYAPFRLFVEKTQDEADVFPGENHVPCVYDFKTDDEKWAFKVIVSFSYKLTEFGKDDKRLHDEAIRFGLWAIRLNPHETRFLLPSALYQDFKQRPALARKDLRYAILSFIYDVSQELPQDGVSVFDLEDSLNATRADISAHLQRLHKAQKLEKVGHSVRYRNERRPELASPYRINPLKETEVRNEIEEYSKKAEESESDSSFLVFISYSHKDKSYCGRLKEALEDYGLSAFLAHDDIKVSQEWQDKILENLDSCHAFVANLTNSFSASAWCDQEAGCALAKHKIMISLKTKNSRNSPHGFLGRYQAIDRKRNARINAREIWEFLAGESDSPEAFRDRLITIFGESKDASAVERRAGVIASIKDFDKMQLETICNLVTQKAEIHKCEPACDILVKFIRRHKQDLSPVLFDQAIRALNSNA